ncbi:MAG TPA: YCF48-related protein, partial [Rubrivivax sp.]|nr:YCF48-related protein [Rubrivivax sp.]
MRTAVGVAAALIVALAGIFAFSPRHVADLAPNRVPIDRMQLNGIARTDAGLVAAGELGHILVSSDGGASWRDAALSAQRQALITRLVFVDGKTGLALGHEGWILRTTDGGLTWKEAAFDDKNRGPLL